MAWSDQAAMVLAPSGSAPREVQRLANTGTTEATNATSLTVGAMATIMVGAAAIRINFGSATAPTVAATDLIIPAYGRFDWTVGPADCFVSIEAADSASAYEAHVWSSSPSA
jgi:hypothetical protein